MHRNNLVDIMKMFRLRIGKWFFTYLDYIVIILATLVLYLIINLIKPLPSWLFVFPIVIALIVKSSVNWRKGKKEELAKLAESLNRVSGEFSKFTQGSCNYSIWSISKEFINKFGSKEGIKGWEAYFNENWGMSGQLFKNYGSFERKMRRYIENPKGKEELLGLVREFSSLVGLHYKMHTNFLEMIRDVGNEEFEPRCNEFKKEYNEFYRGLRRIAPDLRKVLGVELEGKFYFNFAKDFPKAVKSP